MTQLTPELAERLLAAYRPTPHPVFRLPTVEELDRLARHPQGRALLEAKLEEREKKIALMEHDPYHHGYSPACWHKAEELLDRHRVLHITSRNRNTKSEFAAWWTMKNLMQGGRRWWCLCTTHETSIRGGGQQELIYKYLPPNVRAIALNTNRKAKTDFGITYSAKNRFTDNSFIMPTATKPSECRFMTYDQAITIIEGGAIDGFWADEDVPWEWVVKLIVRLLDRDGRGLITCTPAHGWDECYGSFYEGAKVLEWQDFPLFPERRHWPGGPKGKIPYVVQPVDPKLAGMFFPVDANPWVPFEKFAPEFKGRTYEQQMIVLAGVAARASGAQFPKFGKWHIIPKDQVPKEGTNYHFVDFAWERNWANIWVRVVRQKDRLTYYVYRDWPDERTHGPWAERGGKTPGGKRGPAQDKVGLSVAAYKEMVEQLEGKDQEGAGEGEKRAGEIIHTRFGDPRSGAAEAVTRDEAGISFFDMLADVGMTVLPVSVLGKAAYIGEGIKAINELLDFDQEQYRLDGNRFTPLNQPRLFISEECQQVMTCLQLWTPHGPVKDQACKDFIDLLRYMAVEDLEDWRGEIQFKQKYAGGSF